MANPWDNDPVVTAPAPAAANATPWANDPIVTAPAAASPTATPHPIAGLPVPGYPGQFSKGEQPAPAPNGPQYNASVDDFGRPVPGTGPSTASVPQAVQHVASAVGSAFAGPYGPNDETLGKLVTGPSDTLNAANRIILQGGGAVLDAASRPITAAARGLGAAASEVYQAAGGDQGMGARLERDISQAPEALLPLSVPTPNYAKAAPITASERYPAIANKLDHEIATDVQGPGRGGYLLNKLTDMINAVDEPKPATPNALLPPEAVPAVSAGKPAAMVEAAPRAAPAATDAAAPITGPATEPTAAPATVKAPVPDAAGAAPTPASLAAMSPREQAVQQARAENQRLSEPAVAGVDKTEYVPGVKPTAAEIAGNATVSGQQKYVQQSPGYEQTFQAVQRANNEARIEHFDNLAGDAVNVDRLREARSEQAQKDLTAAWQNKADVDASPVVEHIDSVLSGPSGKESAVSGALKKVRDLMYDAKGNLETDPEVLYGARKEVAAMLGKAAQQEKPTLKDAARQLQAVKDQLDSAIEQGASGYKQYLQNFAEASRPIDVHELLQGAKPSLLNGSQRNMTFGSMDRMMRNIVSDRQKSGVNAAKSIDPQTMEGLWNLHSDLKRLGNLDLGKPRGSDTSSLGRIGGALGLAGAHAAAAAVVPFGAGNILVQHMSKSLGDRALRNKANALLDGANYKP